MPPTADPKVAKVLASVSIDGLSVKAALRKHHCTSTVQNINKHLRKRRAANADSEATTVDHRDSNLGDGPPQMTQKPAKSASGKAAQKQPKKTPRQVQQLEVMRTEKKRRFSDAFKTATEE